MTSLKKPVRRISAALVREQGKIRAIVVILRPPNLIGFRAAGCRREYTLTLEGCYTMAVKCEVADQHRKKREARKLRNQANE